MAITKKTPALKQTVGAQYLCFDSGTGFTGTYASDVEKTEVVKSVSVSENIESTQVYASGLIYKTLTEIASAEISVEVIAFEPKTRAGMRGDTLTTAGLLMKGKSGERPYFAYGKVVKFTDSKTVFEWYPKCQLTANTDEASTSETSYSEQNETLTISALPFDDAGNICVAYDNALSTDLTLTEEEFFTAPILSDDDLPSDD